MDKEKVLESTRQIICDLDATTTHIVQARLNHNEKAEGKALFEMEGMIVAAQQQLTCLYDYIYKDLALTWEDMQLICEIEEKLWNEEFQQVLDGKSYVQNHYEEVLRRFNEQKKRNERNNHL